MKRDELRFMAQANQKKDTYLRLRADQALRRRINNQAKADRVPRSHFIREAVIAVLDEKDFERAKAKAANL
jgi:predicted transcriptional regulator